MPKTMWGFPVAADGDTAPAPAEHLGKRGVSLIIAIMIVSVMMLFTTDLIVTSQVNVTLATSHRDSVKAEYMAKAALNFVEMFVSADLAIKLTKIQAFAGQNKNAQVIDSLEDPLFMLNGFPPIGGETAEMLSSFQEAMGLSSVLDSGVMDQLKLFDGTFSFKIEDESRKINVNYLHNGRGTEVMAMLTALFSCPAEKQFLDSKKLTAEELAARIKDYIDLKTDADEKSGFNDENEPYLKREPRQKAKNAPLDSIDELRQIEGWDEEVHAVFSPYLTAYPFQPLDDKRGYSMNINTVSRGMMQCFFPESKGDHQEKTAKFFRDRDKDNTAVAGEDKKIPEVLTELFNAPANSEKAAWFNKMSNVYHIETVGTVGDVVKRLSAVVERTVPDPKKNEKGSNKILYWRIQ